MKWLHPVGKALARGFEQLGQLWQRLLCWLFNMRRGWGRRRWPDYVVFTLEGELVERTPIQPRYYSLLPFFQTPITFESLTDALRPIAQDPDVRGVLFLVKGASLSLAQAQSLGSLFKRFRRWDGESNGQRAAFHPKEVVVFLEQTGNALCALAASADRTVLPPLTDWNATGLHSEPTYLADTLAQVGIHFDVIKVAPWKTAYDRFNRSTMSEAEADQLGWLLDGLYADLVAAIANGRNLPPADVRELIDNAPLTAQDAFYSDLIDEIAYEDELPWLLRVTDQTKDGKLQEREARLLTFAKARRYLLRHPRKRAAGSVGVISLSGAIMPGKSRRFPVELPMIGDSIIGSSTVQQTVRAAMDNDDLAAVVLHIDSGGGSALASDLMWRELELLARKKPLVVYMGNIAASGGYYIATPANRIVAQSATLTGSIGVISGKPVTRGVYDKIGANRYSIRRGDNADIFTDQRAWEGEQRAKIEAQIDHSYSNFKARVAEGRKLPYADLDPICSGKVWTGSQALAHGLIDQLGDFSAALDAACELANLPVNGSVAAVTVQADRPRLPISARKLSLDDDQLAFADLASILLRRDWERLIGAERIWYLADGLPRF
ncbi:MAG: signal peptide peptidase SppA [Caldilineaceae bacterium]|nr:signal peptide peptidase SppA [Caldilineaceae bacterium]